MNKTTVYYRWDNAQDELGWALAEGASSEWRADIERKDAFSVDIPNKYLSWALRDMEFALLRLANEDFIDTYLDPAGDRWHHKR